MTLAHRSRSGVLVLPAALVLALAAGCGGGDQPAADPPPADPPASEAAASDAASPSATDPSSGTAASGARSAEASVRAAATRMRASLRRYERASGRLPATGDVQVGSDVTVRGVPLTSLPTGVEVVRYGLAEPGKASGEAATATFCLHLLAADDTVAAAAFGDTRPGRIEATQEDPTALC